MNRRIIKTSVIQTLLFTVVYQVIWFSFFGPSITTERVVVLTAILLLIGFPCCYVLRLWEQKRQR